MKGESAFLLEVSLVDVIKVVVRERLKVVLCWKQKVFHVEALRSLVVEQGIECFFPGMKRRS